MNKFISTFLVALLIVPCVLGLSACSLFDGNDNENGSGGKEQIASENLKLTGEIPFSLESEFYIQLEVNSVFNSLNPQTYCFIAIKCGDSVYANYTVIKYNNATDYENGIEKEYYTEERLLHEGVDYRKSSAEFANGGSLYCEDWNTLVPNGITMTTTIQYIQNFLNGNHVADTPYSSGHFVNTNKIPSTMSTILIKDISVSTLGVDMYEDGTENMPLDVFTSDDSAYAPEQPFSAAINKYKGIQKGTETTVMNVKTWGNLVVYAAQANGSNVLKKTVSCKYSATVSQSTFEKVLDYAGYTTDPS